MRAIFEKLDEATARIDEVIIIAGMLGDDYDMADPLKAFLDNGADEIKRCFPDLPDWLFEAFEYGDERGAFLQWALENGKFGFLLNFATPVMTHYDGGKTFSWGYYSTCWVYGDTLDDAIAQGLSWVDKKRAAESP